MTRAIEFWFDFGSNYSYVAAMRIEGLARDAGVPLVWRPFLLGPIFKALGWASSPFVVQKEKGAYVWRDMERECARYGIPWNRPTRFPRGTVLGHRMALAADREPWLEAFCKAMFQRNFVQDEEIDDAEAVGTVLASLGQDPAAWLPRATTDDIKLRLRHRTDEAQARGLFGAPTFFVGDEMFWGNDRLEQALDWARRSA